MPLINRWAADGTPCPGLIFTNPKRFDQANLSYPGTLVVELRGFLAKTSICAESRIWCL